MGKNIQNLSFQRNVQSMLTEFEAADNKQKHELSGAVYRLN